MAHPYPTLEEVYAAFQRSGPRVINRDFAGHAPELVKDLWVMAGGGANTKFGDPDAGGPILRRAAESPEAQALLAELPDPRQDPEGVFAAIDGHLRSHPDYQPAPRSVAPAPAPQPAAGGTPQQQAAAARRAARESRGPDPTRGMGGLAALLAGAIARKLAEAALQILLDRLRADAEPAA